MGARGAPLERFVGRERTVKLNVGCGAWIRDGWVNVDNVDLPGVDVIHDLDVQPWPFETGSVERIEAWQVFEHLWEPVGFMWEAWRVLQPGGVLFVATPHWQSRNAHTDPTHKRFCTEETFDYWCVGTHLHGQFGDAYAAGRTFDRTEVIHVQDDIHDDIHATLTKRP